MSKHGRLIKCACGSEHQVNRKNLRKRNQPGGFKCPRCEKAELKAKRAGEGQAWEGGRA